MDAHAQYEIRVFGEALAKCAKAVSPLAYEAFEEHILNSVMFSRAECAALSAMLAGQAHALEGRKAAEFEAKLTKMRTIKPAEEPEEPVLPAPRDGAAVGGA